MRIPSPTQLLQVWERGCDQDTASRALLLLAATRDGPDGDGALASLPVGRRDGRLLRLHARLFGDGLAGLADCPHCGAVVEMALDCGTLFALDAGCAVDAPATFEWRGPATRIRFRLPDSHDLLAIADCEDPGLAAARLRSRCVVEAERDGEAIAPEALTEAEAAGLSGAMSAADPMADLRLAIDCPACGAHSETGFDPARFLWQELHAWALRTLREVDLLARAYHWSEADILALDPRRRRAYLEMCAA